MKFANILLNMISVCDIVNAEGDNLMDNITALEKKYEIRTNPNNNNVLQTFMDYEDRKVFIW